MAIATRSATGAEVEEVVQAILPVLEPFPEHLVLMALLGLLLWIQNPNITPDELAQGTEECSQFISLWSSNTAAAMSVEGANIVH